MTRFNIKTLCSLFTLSLVCLCVTDANACPRSGGGSYYRSSPSYSYSRPTYSRPSYSQPTYSQPVVQSRSVIRSTSVPQNVQQTLAPQPPQQQSPQQQAAVGQTNPQPQVSPQQSALQMLANFGSEPQATTPVVPQGFNGVGTWKATLSNDAVVTLQMQADGSFIWTAIANGKQSTFQGAYTLSSNNLTLSRSNDSQKLDGAITINGDSFTFKIAGSTDAGLTFSRS